MVQTQDEGCHLHILLLQLCSRLLRCFLKCSNVTSTSSVLLQKLPKFFPWARIYSTLCYVVLDSISHSAGSELSHFLHACWPRCLRALRPLTSRTRRGSSSLGNHSFTSCLLLPHLTESSGVFIFKFQPILLKYKSCINLILFKKKILIGNSTYEDVRLLERIDGFT